MGDVEPPGDQPRQRRACCRGNRGGVVVPEEGDAERTGVEALRVGTDDVPLHASEPALEDLAVLVDEEVVADVVPAVGAHVVELDAPDDGRRLRPVVAVRAGRVVDDGEAQGVGVVGDAAPDPLVRPPRETAEDQR
jgi:hypothetical protein